MIDAQLASFLQEGIFIDLATRTERLEPNGARVVAATVEPDGLHLVVYLATSAAPGVLPDLETNGEVAIGFARPPDERACQIKGRFAGVRQADDEDRAMVQRQWDRLLDRLTTIGFERGTFAHYPSWPCVAIRVRVNRIFNQTPGPGAGGPLA
jgi:hypothetical protein